MLAGGGIKKESWDFSPLVLQMRIPKLLYTELAVVNSSALGTTCSLHESLLRQLFYYAVNGSLNSIHNVFSIFKRYC